MEIENVNNKEPKDIFVLKLDISKIFWIITIVLLIITCLFLSGYWLGSSNNIAAHLDERKHFKKLDTYLEEQGSYIHNKLAAFKEKEKPKETQPPEKKIDKPNNENTALNQNKEVQKTVTIYKNPSQLKDVFLTSTQPFTVQAAIFEDQNDALKCVNELKNQQIGYVYSINGVNNNKPVYCVRIGSYSDKVEALRIFNLLKQTQYKNHSSIITL